MLTIRAMSNGRGYAAHHLVHSDYYAEEQRVVGYWHGRGAAELGLVGEVTEEQFEAIRQGFHPDTGEMLRPRQSADRLSVDGEIQSRGRHLYDFTFSAPKSVSVVAALGEDGRLGEAHQRAVETALLELEAAAAARVRLEGANENRLTGNLVLAVYHHDTSRELDPQLHTHAVAGNLTYDGTEGRWKALQASDIYEQRAYLTEVYRNALAHEVRALGYDIDDRHDARGRDLGFEIRGVSEELLHRYSQRSQQRDQAIEVFAEQTGRRPTDNEVAILVRDSRQDKLIEISPAEVRARQVVRLTPEESVTLTELREQALELALEREHIGLTLEPAAPALRYAEQHLFERRSVVQDHELLTEALRQGRGRIALEEAKGVLGLEESSGEILRVGHQVATHESLDREREMIAAINRGIGAFDRLGGEHTFLVSDRLRPDQQHAVHQVLASHDWAISLRGAAGTGKTATLQELSRGLAESGREVVAVAPTRSAVHELQEAGVSHAMTIQRLLVDPEEQAELRDKVLIVDEAGMVSARQMTELLTLAEDQAARVIFSGDTRQLQSVEAGDALRVLERESGLRSVVLTHVQRQRVEGYRHAIEALREDPARGLMQLEQLGAVREVAWADRSRSVAEAWRQAQGNAHDQPRSVLVVCATHDDIAQVTAAIRAEREQAGELGEGVTVDRYVPLHYTLAQKQDPRQFHAGQVLVFHHDTAEIRRDAALEIVQAGANQLLARTAAGEEHIVTVGHAHAFDVYDRRPIEMAPHDRLLLTANWQGPGLRVTNGELVTVSQVDEGGRVHLEDGRMLPSSYKHFDHGYAVTAHRSQGQSVDAVVIAGETMSRELFYVAASRGREQLTVITSDKARLEESVGRSGARLSASELVRTMHADVADRLGPDVSRGFERGIRVVVEAARQSVGCEHDAPGHALSAPVQQQAIAHAPGHERAQPAQQRERGHRYGLSL